MTLNIFARIYGFLLSEHEEDDDDEEEVPEAIASQSSTDTTSCVPQSMTYPIRSADFVCIPRRRGVAVTPDGLMPRQSIAELRAELKLSMSPPSCNLLGHLASKYKIDPFNQREMRFQNESYSKTSSLSSPKSAIACLAPIREERHDHLVLELPSQPTRSWTPSTNTRSNPFSSSCYSSPTAAYPSAWTAESPHLVPGLTKTAVGSLFALQTSRIGAENHADPPGTTPIKSTTNHNSQQWDYTPQEDRVEDMFSPVTTVSNRQQQYLQPPVQHLTTLPNPTTNSSTDRPLFSPCVLSNPRPRKTQHRATEVIVEKWKNIDLQLIKARNQKHQKEDLLVQVFERLQDNVELIRDIESLYFNNNAKTTTHALLVGLNESDRHEVLDKIDMILLELNQDVPTTEFFFSPGKFDHQDFRQDHSKLQSALNLTKSFVELAIPSDEKETASLQSTSNTGYWKFLQHETIGISVPDTPTAADSSFFSLPEAATTPMTSNVSLGNSTLTTRPQTVAGNHTSAENNGLELRQALHILSNGLERIGTAIVNGMIERNDLIGSTEEIKAAVAEMWTLSTTDLTTMVDAFEFVLMEEEHGKEPHYHQYMDHGTILHAQFLGSGSIVSREAAHNDDDSSSLAEDDLRRSSVGSIDEKYEKEDQEEDENNMGMPSSPLPWQVYL